MPVIVAKKEEIQKYYESEALGQSKLKLLLGDLASFNKEFDSSAEHFLIGSAVDCILTNSEEAFNEEYYVSDTDKLPSDTIVEIIKRVYEMLLEDYAECIEVTSEKGGNTTTFLEFIGDIEQWSTYILDACEYLNWQPRWGAEAKLKNILSSGTPYFKDLCAAFGKKVLSKTQYSTIRSIVNSLQTNFRTAGYFDRVFFENHPDIEVYYQFPIYFEYRGVQCKSLLDMVFVEKDHTGTIISITGADLKTMSGNTYNFPESLRKRRYDQQAAYYQLALSKYFGLPESSDKIKPFQFVVESTTNPGKPLCFEVSRCLLKVGREGLEPVYDLDTNRLVLPKVEGIEDLLDKYIYHTENGFNLEKDIQKYGNQPIRIDWDGII